MKSFLITLVGLVSLAAASVLPRQETPQAATDRLLFRTSLADFVKARNANNPSSLDWSSDGCSSSPDNPFGFDYHEECLRHDFGYRNYKKQNRFPAGKASIDLNFRQDMYNQCDTEEDIFRRAACRVGLYINYCCVRQLTSHIGCSWYIL